MISSIDFASLTNSPFVLPILSLFSFSESAFFVIPPEVLLIPLGLSNPQMALFYALVTTVASVLGASFGFYIGQKGGKPLLKKLFSQDKIDKVKHLFQKYDASALLVAAITPIPFKVFTISAGVFDIEFKRLIITSIIGRGGRYFLISTLIYFLGESIRSFIETKLDKALLIFTLLIILAIVFYKLIWPKIEKQLTKLTLKQRLLSFFRFK